MLGELVSERKVTEIEKRLCTSRQCVSTRNHRNRHLQQVNKWPQEESGKLEERALESRFLRAEKGQLLRF